MRLSKSSLFIYSFAVKEEAAATGVAYLRKLWEGCERLGMTEPIAAWGVPNAFPSEFDPHLFGTRVLAATQSPMASGGVFNAVVLEHEDLAGVLVCLAPNNPGDSLKQWHDLAARWRGAIGTNSPPEGIIGEFFRYSTLADPDDEVLIRKLAASVPDSGVTVRSPRPATFHSREGFRLWESCHDGRRRSLALVAPEEAEEVLDQFALFRGAGLGVLPLYFIQSAKLTYEYEVYIRDAPGIKPRKAHVDQQLAETLRVQVEFQGQLDRGASVTTDALTASQNRLSRALLDASDVSLDRTRVSDLRRTVGIVAHNLELWTPSPHPSASADAATLFSRDRDLAAWLVLQTDHDLSYLDSLKERVAISQEQTARLIGQAAERLGRSQARLTLVQTTLLGSLLFAMTAIQAFAIKLPSGCDALHMYVLPFLVALPLFLPPLVLHWYEHYRPADYHWAALLGATVGWFAAGVLAYALPGRFDGSFSYALPLGFALTSILSLSVLDRSVRRVDHNTRPQGRRSD